MPEVPVVPVIGISLTLELPGKRALVFQTHTEQGVDKAALNAVIDKMHDAGDRQFSRCLVENLKLQLEQEKKIAQDHVKRMAQVEENMQREWGKSSKRGEMQLSPKQQTEQQQALAHMEESKRRIAMVEKDIAEHQARIG